MLTAETAKAMCLKMLDKNNLTQKEFLTEYKMFEKHKP